ncbi:MAG TPA: hypothetical protein VMD02_04185, partial [Candidatus Omnitrophota bacterium]|nr:hypothetical protein [Candidatus Omnitrophota bacterium]
MRTNPINYNGRILITGMELGGVRGKGIAGKATLEMANFLSQRGIQCTVVIPSSMAEPFNARSFGNYHVGTVGQVNVVALDSSLTTIYPENLSSARNFTREFWKYAVGQGNGFSLVHGLDWPSGITLWEHPEELPALRTVFSPFNPLKYDRILAVHNQGEGARFGDHIHGSFHHNGISGFKAGVLSADVVTFWSRAQLAGISDPAISHYGLFMQHGMSTNPDKFKVFEQDGNPWTPEDLTSLPWRYVSRLQAFYLEALFGSGHDYSLNLASARPLSTDINGLNISTTEKHVGEKRGNILKRRMEQAYPGLNIHIHPRFVAKYQDSSVYQGYRGNVGGIIQMLQAISKDPDPEGTHLAFLNGGDGERGFVTTLNSCVKGELVLGEKSIGEISQLSAAMVARQLPAKHGWVVIFGCDNFMIPNGPIRIGD